MVEVDHNVIVLITMENNKNVSIRYNQNQK